MFINTEYKYIPLLAIKPAEMSALEELPEKDKNLLLPLFPIKRWATSKKIENTFERITKAFGNRSWIADIDSSSLSNQEKSPSGEYKAKVFAQLEALTDPTGGFLNWCNLLKEMPNAIPCLQLNDLTALREQISNLIVLNRGIVCKFDFSYVSTNAYTEILNEIALQDYKNNLVIFDFKEINKQILESAPLIATVLKKAHDILPDALFSITGTSFPDGFANQHLGENPINERLLYQKVMRLCQGIKLIYSDKGSTKANGQGGGGAVPPYPRIDYPQKNEWRFVREEFENPYDIKDGEKKELYTQAAIKLMDMDYWIDELQLWGVQLIELTAKSDKMGISNPMKATSVRINIHLHLQLHYDEVELVDTDEDWED